jgi:hypothetical protein
MKRERWRDFSTSPWTPRRRAALNARSVKATKPAFAFAKRRSVAGRLKPLARVQALLTGATNQWRVMHHFAASVPKRR